MLVYVLTDDHGEYSQRDVIVCGVFTSIELAKQHVADEITYHLTRNKRQANWSSYETGYNSDIWKSDGWHGEEWLEYTVPDKHSDTRFYIHIHELDAAFSQ